jgi:hypothetical protein
MLNAKIADIKKRLGVKSFRRPSATVGQTKTHRMSSEGRARIAAAQRKRWAAVKKARAAAA